MVRLLQTLVALGYAQRVSRQDGYRLTDRVLGLPGSIRFVDHLVDAAIPHMSGFTAQHGWPLYLATLSDGALTIRHSTAPESPMAFEAAALNTRRSILTSALGRELLVEMDRLGMILDATHLCDDAFWDALKHIAAERKVTLSDVVQEVDQKRKQGNLSSAIRLFVLDHYRSHYSAGKARA